MISENVFTQKDILPAEEEIEKSLKSKYAHLETVRQFIHDMFGDTIEEWKYYGKKSGWILKKFYKKRNLFFISIYEGYFKISFVFGEKAVSAIAGSAISPELKAELANAKKYAEGQGLTIIVDDVKYLTDIKQLIQIKIEN